MFEITTGEVVQHSPRFSVRFPFSLEVMTDEEALKCAEKVGRERLERELETPFSRIPILKIDRWIDEGTVMGRREARLTFHLDPRPLR